MRSRSGRLTMLTSAAMVSGLLTLTNVSPASAQTGPAAPPAGKPAAPATVGAAPTMAPAKPAAPAAQAAPTALAPAATGTTPPATGTTPPAAGATGTTPPAAGTPATATPGKTGEPAAKVTTTKPKKPLTDKQKKDEAKKLYKDAEARFEKGEYATAADLYRQADEYVPGAAPKYKLALSLDKQGLATEAVAAWQAFLDSKPDAEKFKDKITEAQGRVEALKKTPAKVRVATEPDAPQNLKIAVDGVPQAGKELAVPPGKHTLTVSAEGFVDSSQELEVTFAETRDVSVTLTPKPPEPVAAAPAQPATPPPAITPPPAQTPPPAAPVEPRSPVPAYVTLGLAGAGVVVGTIFGIQALSAKSDFDDSPTTKTADRVDRNALIADMSFAVALTFGVTGAVLLLSDDTPAETKAAASSVKKNAFVAPFVSPTGGGAAARFTF
ncbi:PEGA domain-containing protein [Sorangium sp. So ce1182]|uniref:PEGA domain-containing protein n=1 Tax=Sorangium sp. So ce1182 TaxID=3133334 RepID=UPI003F63FEFD